ncbi:ATP-binding protein [Nisaea sp.]|uniref:sensor histidine kinase n=1 Tax=Nisaea sp. TaxID=2024842 RepID=UPI0032630C99
MLSRKTPLYSIILFSFFVMATICTASQSHAIEEKKRILIINSFNWGGVWADSEVQGFRSTLKEKNINASLFIEQMDVIGKRGVVDYDYFANHLKWRFGAQKFDIVVANDDPAMRFVVSKYHDLFDGAPVIFVDVNSIREILIPQYIPYTGITEQNDFLSTLEIARELRPNASTVAVFGNSAHNGAGPRHALTFLMEMESDLPFAFHLDKTVEEIQDISSQLTSEDIVIGIAYAKDRFGITRDYNEVRGAISKVSPAASFVFWKTADDDKFAIGGKVSSANDQGRASAEIAARVLAGENIRSIPIMAAPTKYIFNYPIMVRMGIDVDDLPLDAEFIQKPFSAYETFKSEIWSAIISFIVLFLVIFLLLININRRKSAEAALEDAKDKLENTVSVRTAELVSTNDTLQETVSRLQKTQDQLIESEKMAALGGLVSGVAHEINTPLGISITAASHFEEMTDNLLLDYKKGNISRSRLENYFTLVSQTTRMLLSNLGRAANLISSFKQISVDQSIEKSRPIDLVEYVQTVADSLQPELKPGGHAINITGQDNLVVTTYPGIIAQILTNLVVNSVRHGFGVERREGKIQIEIASFEDAITLTYGDNGKGMTKDVLDHAFDPFFTTTRGQGGSGLGLSIVYNLVTHKLAGQIKCESALNEQTRFILTFPAQAPIANE